MARHIEWAEFESLVRPERLGSISTVIQFIERNRSRPVVVFGNKDEIDFVKWYLDIFGIEVKSTYETALELCESEPRDILVISARNYEPHYIAANRLKLLKDMGQLRAHLFSCCCAMPSPILYDRGKSLHRLIENGLGDIRETYLLLNDDLSRSIYLNVILLRISGNGSFIPYTPYSQYLHPSIKLSPNPVIIDGGAYDGDSAKIFYQATLGQCLIYSFEPSPDTYIRLIKNLEHAGLTDRVIPLNFALWSKTDTLKFMQSIDPSSNKLSLRGEITVRAISIDDFMAKERVKKCDYVKLDVEGAEPEVLLGCQETIDRHSPALSICVYHDVKHLLSIPQMLKKMYPQYKLYLGHHHPKYVYETVLYATRS
ncbi:FkbM family methyltransferase [Alicyclobacillus herbarius]|uniref:FkbM family methyltransferase n=1 Tax=Alicyclobacillus herbarius TaxID=122960 RepID=UPI0003F847B4|nr:FkbM family methyltransferase [Alicyclobacillus herbarius]